MAAGELRGRLRYEAGSGVAAVIFFFLHFEKGNTAG